jgi:hypothetical protein
LRFSPNARLAKHPLSDEMPEAGTQSVVGRGTEFSLETAFQPLVHSNDDCEHVPCRWSADHELGSSVCGIGYSLDVAQSFELVDELTHSGARHAGAFGQHGRACAAAVEIGEHSTVLVADVLMIGSSQDFEQFVRGRLVCGE